MIGNLGAGTGASCSASRRSPGFAAETSASQPAAPENAVAGDEAGAPALAWTSLALALSGFAAMGMEILWFRHFTVLLGGFRAVYSLLLMVILIGIGAGSLVGGWLQSMGRATRAVADDRRGTVRRRDDSRVGERRHPGHPHGRRLRRRLSRNKGTRGAGCEASASCG